ncbi:MAG: acetylglutamate kinase [Cytophagales bacterium]|nr:acetylglutamate kinase [Cytophagales bacterium]
MSTEPIYIVKTGGAILEDSYKSQQLLNAFSEVEGPKILVHGGGRRASSLAEKLGVKAPLIEGRRITDDDMLEVAVMVYGGLMNKQLVAELQARGVNALGLTGADGNLIKAHKRAVKAGIDYGWAGDVDQVNTEFLSLLFERGFAPVLAAITHDKMGQLLNTNADTIATQVGLALAKSHEVHLIFLFEQPGVMESLENPDSLITSINARSYRKLKEAKKIHSGMIPKLDNAFAALDKGVKSVRIGQYDRLGDIINNQQNFTLISS